jgi:hypothetical protein
MKCFLDNEYVPSKKPVPQTIKIDLKNIDSKIITNQHAELISKWIDKLKITDELKILYEFKLILRGSRDGFTAEKFHEICDNKSHTVTITKVSNSDEILGGYNPTIWESRERDVVFGSEYSRTKDSFIFSFSNKKDIKNHILSRVRAEKYAIDNAFNCGPSFGLGDLTIHGVSFKNCTNYCIRKSYDKLIRKTEGMFSIEEYEIFQIIEDDRLK